MANFRIAKFSDTVDFAHAEFPGVANFARAEFSRGTNFWGAKFSEAADFTRAEFSEEANFTRVEFSGRTNFWEAKFSEKADFVNATFPGEAGFVEATFSAEADFGGAEFSGVTDFESVFEGKADFSRTRFLKDFYLNSAVFKGWNKTTSKTGNNATSGSSSLSLENSVYPHIYVNLPDDPEEVPKFLNLNNPDDDPKRVEDTYLRLLKNQKDLGRPYKGLYIAMKRHQRKQKFFLARWFERWLFDSTTEYGTASFPPVGVLIYMGFFLGIFTAGYYFINWHLRRSRGVEILEYHNTDGGEAKSQRKLGRWEIVWFSLNTFIPAVHFVNVQHWRITDDRFLKIKCSTLATVESILGWLLIPILLRYFRL